MPDYLTGEQMLAADDVEVHEVDCSDTPWKGIVCLKVMGGTELDAFNQSQIVIRGGKVTQDLSNSRSKLLVRCICDAKGKRLFNDSQIEALGKKNGIVLDRLYAKAREINKLDRVQIEDLKKNSDSTESSDSS